ncbi:MAG: dihydropteroate synthase [Propionibacteriaceae bacterium]|jgi:dihydropteroate synthase|nr:dihydropteroate synthase [Propionibacteriaceae bacterium]
MNPTCLVGILNVTPDSFSDGGQFLDPATAAAHGLALSERGAAWVDVGGESTRPGATPVPLKDELSRVLPVVEGLAAQGVAVSVDTVKAEVARAAVAAGATLVNDVSGGLADAAMLPLMGELGVRYVVGHWRGWMTSGAAADYGDVVEAVIGELGERVEAALQAGVPQDNIVIDPGLGFSKSAADNWALLRAADRIQDLGWPVLWGASRKRFLAESGDRDAAGVAVTTYLAERGAWGVRVHDVAAHAAALRAVEALAEPGARRQASPGSSAPAPVGAHAGTGLPHEVGARAGTGLIHEVGARPGTGPWHEVSARRPDRIELKGVTAWGLHGVLPEEKADAQPFAVDLTAHLSANPPDAPTSCHRELGEGAFLRETTTTRSQDDASGARDGVVTVDYSRLSALVVDAIEHESFDLVETLADHIARSALAVPGVAAVDVTVHKPRAPLPEAFDDVAVTVHREPAPPRRQAVFSLGSNLGDRLAWLRFGVTGLVTTPGLDFLAVSDVHETEPVGVGEQPLYLNAVLIVESDWPAHALLRRGQALEALAGRDRQGGGHPPRTLDVDLIAVGDEAHDCATLTLPHPRAAERSFVTVPWAEAAARAGRAGRGAGSSSPGNPLAPFGWAGAALDAPGTMGQEAP